MNDDELRRITTNNDEQRRITTNNDNASMIMGSDGLVCGSRGFEMPHSIESKVL